MRPILLLLAATLLATGCTRGPLPGAQATAAGALGARSTGQGPTLEAAYDAARDAAAQAAGGPVEPVFVAGWDLARDGRPRPDGNYAFTFAARSAAGRRSGLAFDVGPDGQVVRRDGGSEPPPGSWALDRTGLTTAAQAIARSGLDAPSYTLHLAPAERMFTGAGPANPRGPLLWLVNAGDPREMQYRIVSARRGEVHAPATAAEQQALASLIRSLMDRFRLAVTRGQDRAIAPGDLQAHGWPVATAADWVKQHDADRDGLVAAAELHARYASGPMLQAWREQLIKGQLWAADADGDERLSPAEAPNVRFTLLKPGALGSELHPLGLTAADVRAADRDGDGLLSADEFVPLGTAKTAAYLQAHPLIITRFFTEAKPWSH